MSYNELMDAYKGGRISRRTFVRGMVATGLTVAVANRLADSVTAAPRAVGEGVYGEDVYGPAGGGEELPATGTGASSGSGLSMKVLAIGGAAAAAGAAVVRRLSGKTSGAE